MKGKKNDYSLTFFFYNTKTLHLHYVHNTEKATKWATEKGIKWTHANIYNRRSKIFLERVYSIDKNELMKELFKLKNNER